MHMYLDYLRGLTIRFPVLDQTPRVEPGIPPKADYAQENIKSILFAKQDGITLWLILGSWRNPRLKIKG
jgi:hypothetical protein